MRFSLTHHQAHRNQSELVAIREEAQCEAGGGDRVGAVGGRLGVVVALVIEAVGVVVEEVEHHEAEDLAQAEAVEEAA